MSPESTEISRCTYTWCVHRDIVTRSAVPDDVLRGRCRSSMPRNKIRRGKEKKRASAAASAGDRSETLIDRGLVSGWMHLVVFSYDLYLNGAAGLGMSGGS